MPAAATLDGTEIIPVVQAGVNVKSTSASIAALAASMSYIGYAGPPNVNPPALMNIVVDVNGRQWQYFGGAWN